MYDEFRFVTLKMRLAVAEPFVLTDGMLKAPIPEATFIGYAPQTMTGWTEPSSLGLVSSVRTDQPNWHNDDTVSVPILGWYVTDLEDKVWFAFKYETPVVLAPGDDLAIPFVHQYRTW